MQVGLGGIDPLGALDNLPEGVENKVDRDADVSGDKVVKDPGLKDVEAVEENDDGKEDKGGVGGVGLEGRFEDERVAVDTLRLERLVKLDVGDTDADPGEEVGDCGEVLEPLEHERRARRATEKGQEGNGGSNDDTVVWNAPNGNISNHRVRDRVDLNTSSSISTGILALARSEPRRKDIGYRCRGRHWRTRWPRSK